VIRDNARVLRSGAIIAVADLREIYTWKTWIFAWLSRILCQVTFFAFIGKLLHSQAELRYLLIGNSVFIVTMVAMFACVSAAWERQSGTLPLLIASPSSLLTVFAGRSINWLVDGSACAAISLLLLGPLFKLTMPWPRSLFVIPLIVCTGLSTYCLGLALAGIVLRRLELRNLVANLAYLSLMVISGAEVPVTFLPRPVQYAANILPLTHGLAAIRYLLAGAAAGRVLDQGGMELAIGLGWLAVAFLVFRHLAERGRRDGSIEFGSL
jgi:ABC-2 type transport system permease protein